MTVKCGNKRVHGQHSIVYHRDAGEVKACFNGFTPPPIAGTTVQAGTARDRRYRSAVDAAWDEHAMLNEFFDGEVQLIRQAKEEFYRVRGIMLTEGELS